MNVLHPLPSPLYWSNQKVTYNSQALKRGLGSCFHDKNMGSNTDGWALTFSWVTPIQKIMNRIFKRTSQTTVGADYKQSETPCQRMRHFWERFAEWKCTVLERPRGWFWLTVFHAAAGSIVGFSSAPPPLSNNWYPTSILTATVNMGLKDHPLTPARISLLININGHCTKWGHWLLTRGVKVGGGGVCSFYHCERL